MVNCCTLVFKDEAYAGAPVDLNHSDFVCTPWQMGRLVAPGGKAGQRPGLKLPLQVLNS